MYYTYIYTKFFTDQINGNSEMCNVLNTSVDLEEKENYQPRGNLASCGLICF